MPPRPSRKTRSVLEAVDHLVWAVPELEAGIEEVEDRLGVRPAPGGRHPRWGTRNALLSLGPGRYLEVIAPDPDAEAPPPALPFGLPGPGLPRLVTWAARSDDPEADAAASARAGTPLGEVLEGARARPDGTTLSWRLTDPYAARLDGPVPFLIDWGESRHPSADAPAGCRLEGLELRHPDPAAVGRALEALGIAGDATPSRRAGLSARIRTPDGVVTLPAPAAASSATGPRRTR